MMGLMTPVKLLHDGTFLSVSHSTSKEVSEGFWRFLKVSEGFWRFLEDSGGFWRFPDLMELMEMMEQQ